MHSKRILFITTGIQIRASSRSRVYNYRPFLEKDGFSVKIVPYNTSIDVRYSVMNKKRSLMIRMANKINHFFKCILYLSIASQYDVIFIQRVLLPKGVFRLLRVLNNKIIFDFDDAIYLADRWSKSFLGKQKFLRRFQYIVKHSDCIIVSNEALKKVASKLNSNVIKLSTPVDTLTLRPRDERDYNGKVVIWWIGSPDTTRYVEPLKRVFESLAKKYPFLKMELIGANPFSARGVDVTVKKWRLEEEARDLQGFDIGIMPLDDDEWSVAKGGYKLLQYMAAGIPSVASPVGINREIIEEQKTGFLANTPQEWIDRISILIEDEVLRKRMGMEGRRRAESIYSYEANAPKLLEIFRNI